MRFGFFAKVSFVYCPTLENSLALPCGDSVHIACVSFKDPQLTGPSTVGIISNFIPTSMHSRHEEHCQRFHGSKRLELIPLSWLSLHPCLAQGQVWYMNIVGHISCDSLMNPDLERAARKKTHLSALRPCALWVHYGRDLLLALPLLFSPRNVKRYTEYTTSLLES